MAFIIFYDIITRSVRFLQGQLAEVQFLLSPELLYISQALSLHTVCGSTFESQSSSIVLMGHKSMHAGGERQKGLRDR